MATAPYTDDDRRFMARALELARRGEGHVEPNPMVGCVLVRDGAIVGEGWHARFGGPHAEIEALNAAGDAARGATAYVTLEPCVHTGKTPPCTRALISAGVTRVIAACRDPNLQVNGGGLAELEAAGVRTDVGLLEEQAADVLAPFTKLVTTGRPWVIAKWAMTLDGKLATRTGDSRWISGEQSRALVHELRGRVDAIVVGRGTVEADDPLLTARPPGPRTPVRIVLDSRATLPLDSQLVATVTQAPVLVAATHEAPAEHCRQLVERGVEVWQSSAADPADGWLELLDELGRRQMTNVLVEGGAKVLGSLLDANAIDEVHAFVAPQLVGGSAPSPVAGHGVPSMNDAIRLGRYFIEQLGGDAYIHGRCQKIHSLPGARSMVENSPKQLPPVTDSEAAPPPADAVRKYLLYTLSLPERAFRSSVGVVGGAVRESAGLLVPQALRDSQTYRVLVQQTLDFLVQDVGGVAGAPADANASPRVEQFVARKTVGNFVEMAGLATLHLSPMLLLAVVSDVAYGSQAYLRELADELRRAGVIDEYSTINSTSDLLDAIGSTARVASSAFDTPPLSLDGLRYTVQQTAEAARRIDVAKALPQAEMARIWQEMHEVAAAEHVSVLEVSSAMTMHALQKIANVGRGALSSVRVAGQLVDRHLLDYYQTALADIHRQGYYATLAKVSGPYIEGVWRNFSSEKTTISEELVTGELISKGAKAIGRWLGFSRGAQGDQPMTNPASAEEESR